LPGTWWDAGAREGFICGGVDWARQGQAGAVSREMEPLDQRADLVASAPEHRRFGAEALRVRAAGEANDGDGQDGQDDDGAMTSSSPRWGGCHGASGWPRLQARSPCAWRAAQRGAGVVPAVPKPV